MLINVLDSKLRCHVFKSPPDQKFGSSFLPHLHRKVLSLLKRLDKKTLILVVGVTANSLNVAIRIYVVVLHQKRFLPNPMQSL